MVKQLLLPLLAVAAFIVLVGLLVNSKGLNLPGLALPTSAPTTQKEVIIKDIKINVELADTKEERGKGLSGRSSLDEYSGMLFVFDSQNVTPTFWMKGMIIAIDIIWIDDGVIVKIDKDVKPPAPGTSDDKLKTYSGGRPIDYVLEVSSGFSDRRGFTVGDAVAL